MAKGRPMKPRTSAPPARPAMNASAGKSHNYVKAEEHDPRSAKGAKTGGK